MAKEIVFRRPDSRPMPIAVVFEAAPAPPSGPPEVRRLEVAKAFETWYLDFSASRGRGTPHQGRWRIQR